MSDLINRQNAIELIHSLYPSAPILPWNRKRWEKKYKPYIETEKVLEMLPSAQPEIIRCKECKWFGDIGCAIKIVDDSDKPMENDFCSFAERRTDEL